MWFVILYSPIDSWVLKINIESNSPISRIRKSAHIPNAGHWEFRWKISTQASTSLCLACQKKHYPQKCGSSTKQRLQSPGFLRKLFPSPQLSQSKTSRDETPQRIRGGNRNSTTGCIFTVFSKILIPYRLGTLRKSPGSSISLKRSGKPGKMLRYKLQSRFL